MQPAPRQGRSAPRGDEVRFVPPPKPARKKPRYPLDDVILAACGLALGIGAAYFPWYVFKNPEKFGVTALRFEGAAGTPDVTGPFYTPRVQWSPSPVDISEAPSLPLDFVPTGTVPVRQAPGGPAQAPTNQPFPGQPASFDLLHIENGLAMIRDGNGIFLVERGSILPDNSKVVSIERRDGKWVLVTSANTVIEVTP